MQVADARNQRRREGQSLVPPDGLVAMLLQRVEQHQRLVERQRADRVLQQQAQPVGRQRPELGGPPPLRPEERRHPEVVDPFLAEPFQNLAGNVPGVGKERLGVDAPVHLGPAREAGHRIALYADAGDTELLALDQRRAGAAEGIEDPLRRIHPEGVEVVAHQVRREREDEAVPVVNGAVLGPQPVPRRRAPAAVSRCSDAGHVDGSSDRGERSSSTQRVPSTTVRPDRPAAARSARRSRSHSSRRDG